ncbi:MAG: LPS translocon maturation chaperone LptM [Rhodanobacter sp.]
MHRSLLLLPLCLVAALLAGCGQKGPLVMPPAPVKPASASSTVKPDTVKPQVTAPAFSSTAPATDQY